MKCKILHESKNRIRVHLFCNKLSDETADIFEAYFMSLDGISYVKFYERSNDAVIAYDFDRVKMLASILISA